MVVRIRLARFGRKHKAFYRVIVADARSPRDGGFIEALGFYDPHKTAPKDEKKNIHDPETSKVEKFVVKKDRMAHWLSCGAEPTDVLKRFIARSGDFEKFSERYGQEMKTRMEASIQGREVAEKRKADVEARKNKSPAES